MAVQLFRNPGRAVMVDHSSNVSIQSNTVYTPAGDGLRIQDGAASVSVTNNILWTDGGYDLYVTTDSQQGFVSDYNNLYTTDPARGTPVRRVQALWLAVKIASQSSRIGLASNSMIARRSTCWMVM